MTQRARGALWGFGAGFLAAATASKLGFGQHDIQMTAWDWMGIPLTLALLIVAVMKHETN